MRTAYLLTVFLCVLCFTTAASARETVWVRPVEIDDVLTNPGIGFNTFQRFNGDTLNPGHGWTEGFPIEYQDFDGDLRTENYPMCSTAYWRVYWRFIEPEQGKYRWDMIDKALKTAAERRQTLILRIAPYGTDEKRDVPGWYREMVGPKKDTGHNRWRVSPEDPRYVEHFGGLIRKMGARYDGHPDLEIVDVSIVGYWGE
ncbi:MAG: beta-galactosidase, partial [Gemmatimonadota bacterium]|nr:beta-galactosidase [Gemmatimonadota bacterium]